MCDFLQEYEDLHVQALQVLSNCLQDVESMQVVYLSFLRFWTFSNVKWGNSLCQSPSLLQLYALKFCTFLALFSLLARLLQLHF